MLKPSELFTADTQSSQSRRGRACPGTRGRKARLCVLVASAATLLAVLSACDARVPVQEVDEQVVILGFDGADPDLVAQWMAEGKLPHIERLSRSGTVGPLRTTDPPESPVAWASFATGMNPGKHGIFDFLQVDREKYLPDLGLTTVEKPRFLFGSIPLRAARHTNKRRGTPFYKILADHGIRASVLRMPLAFPPEDLPNGRLLSGLGVTDVRDTWGTFFYFATDLTEWDMGSSEFGGVLARLERERGRMTAQVEGPFDPRRDDFRRLSVPLDLEVTADEQALKIRVQGREQVVRERAWSDWFEFRFQAGLFHEVRGVSRFYVLETFPEVRLYLEPISLDPRDPPVPLSSPREFSADLAQRIGLYKTVGWVHETWGLNEEKIDEKTFMEDLFRNMDAAEAALFDQLRDKPSLTLAVFTATDSVSHMFYRLLDPSHPRYDPGLEAEFGDAILRVYQRMDSIIGKVLEQLGDRGTLLVVSDHGFHSWRTEFNTNTWLFRNGFLRMKEDAGEGQGAVLSGGSFFPNVDWSRSRAYSLGLNGIYVNLRGREGQGAVEPGDEYETVRREIEEKLREYRDPDTGEPVVQAVHRRDALYEGPELEKAPDLLVAFRGGYRTSWETALGAVPEGIVMANLKKWSGDHCSSDSADTAGIFLSNRKAGGGAPGLIDIAPTVLRLFGVPVPAEMDGLPISFSP